ncbi:MAG TPA: hypothetical protein ENI79_00065, partial [Rhodospirillales bacterium]|nr:hypothetical protein [Rhodospirillales bacterium]
MATAGDGNLSDYSECSWELREYLSRVPSAVLNAHISHCLTRSFDNSGLVLQDLVNELGRRLDCRVENGLYRGRQDAIGFDGLWQSPEGHSLVVEVKTSDTFRISLDVIAGYRNALVRQDRIAERATILIVVGRQETGEVEDQIRGSRHAWDARLISTEALADLVAIKENLDCKDAASRIRGLLEPFDYI